MFVLMPCRSAVVAAITLSLVFYRADGHVSSVQRSKGNVDVFNVLLQLYKINPLKESKVFKTFSDNVFIHNEKIDHTMSFESRENNITTEAAAYKQKPDTKQLFEMERQIHTKNKQPVHSSMEKHIYDIENIDTEQFDDIIIFHDNRVGGRQNPRYGKDNLRGIVDLIGSNQNEINDDMPVTKSISVNGNVDTRNMTNTVLIPIPSKEFDQEKIDGISDNRVLQINNDIQEAPLMNDIPADVIVL